MRTRASIVTASPLLIFTSLFGETGLAQTKSTVEEPRPFPPGLDDRFLDTSAFLADAKRKNIDLTQKENGYTPLQQFFLGYGQGWCGTMRPEQIRLQVQTDPHSPREFRVKGVVWNMPEFGHAFGCKVGQPMMPQTVCRLW